MTNKIPYLLLILEITCTVMIAGCRGKYGRYPEGPAFQTIAEVPGDQALIYIFRKEQFTAGGYIFYLYANDTLITSMRLGGYFPYFTKPGKIILSTESAAGGIFRYTVPTAIAAAASRPTEKITLDVEKGKIYFLELKVYVTGNDIVQVDKATAEQKLKKCRLLEKWQEEE